MERLNVVDTDTYFFKTMKTVRQIIEAIETFIQINGDRFKLYYLKYGMRGEGLPFRKIEEIQNNHGSLSEYIAQFIDTYNPQSIEVVTKKTEWKFSRHSSEKSNFLDGIH